MGTEDDQLYNGIRSNVYDFLYNDRESYESVDNLLQSGSSRLIINVNHFDKLNEGFSRRLLSDPFTYFIPTEDAYRNVFDALLRRDPIITAKHNFTTPKLGITDWLGSHTVTPRGLTARLVNKMVCVEGIVTRCSLVHPKLHQSVHIAENSGRCIIRGHFDSAAVHRDRHLSQGVPKTDAEGNEFKVEVGLSRYRDFQRLTIQEMPEFAPTGQLPRSVDVVAEDDLVDAAKPGDRVRIFGLYRGVIFKEGGRVTGYAKTFVVANNIEQINRDALSPSIEAPDITAIKTLARRPDLFDLMSQSMAPSICGQEFVKKGLLLQLLGGEQKLLENGMRLRGDIHILLIGDPSCGKSQLLRFMMNISPLALSTTGRGSSGVGLTAAVSSDPDTGERKLEAGAMVLGDKGLVCIDEFDKMSPEDRVAIHEVMEQQTVTISKAGIQTTLNARCSVLAAANPLYGSFDPNLNLKAQISFPDSLLSRFDLIFIVRDAQTLEDDRRICRQVLRQLRHKADDSASLLAITDTINNNLMHSSNNSSAGGQSASSTAELGIIQPRLDGGKQRRVTQVWESLVGLSSTVGGDGGSSGDPNDSTVSKNADRSVLSTTTPVYQKVLSTDFLRKYLHYVKSACPTPRLSDAAVQHIAQFYADLRQRFSAPNQRSRNYAIPTARTLEACVRLATAHARMKLQDTVELSDAEEAANLLLYALCGEIPNEKDTVPDDSDDEDNSSDDGCSSDGNDDGSSRPTNDQSSAVGRRQSARRQQQQRRQIITTPRTTQASSDTGAAAASRTTPRTAVTTVAASKKRPRGESTLSNTPDRSKRGDAISTNAASASASAAGSKRRRTAATSVSALAANSGRVLSKASMERHTRDEEGDDGNTDLSVNLTEIDDGTKSQGSLESASQSSSSQATGATAGGNAVAAAPVDPKRYRNVVKILGGLQKTSQDGLQVKEAFKRTNAQPNLSRKFEWEEYLGCLQKLQSENKIMLVEGEIWFI